MSDFATALERARAGGPQRHHDKSREQGKLPARERVARLVDPGSLVEDALLANWQEEGLGADGVITGLATVAGRPVALMANDPTVKAGSWGPKTVEKIIRVQEQALAQRVLHQRAGAHEPVHALAGGELSLLARLVVVALRTARPRPVEGLFEGRHGGHLIQR